MRAPEHAVADPGAGSAEARATPVAAVARPVQPKGNLTMAPIHDRLRTTRISKRDLLKGGAGLAASVSAFALAGGAANAASVVGVPWFLPRKPGYLYVRGRAADFDTHIDSERRYGKFDMGGVDVTFGDGAPLLCPVNGKIKTAREFRNSGKNTKIDYGIVQIIIAHQKDMFVGPFHKADVNFREMVIGRQGKSGSGATRSHVHVTVYGNAVLCADKERRLPYSHNYLKRDGVRGRFGEIPHRISPYYLGGELDSDRPMRTRPSAYFWNFVLGPDRLTPDGRPLYESYCDPAIDYDSPYLSFVQSRIVAPLHDIAADLEQKKDPAEKKFAVRLKQQIEHWPLYDVINRLWILYEMGLKQRSAGQMGFDLRKRLEVVFDDVREAGTMIKLTSPYINPDDSNVILAAMARNPEREALIRAFYHRFLPNRLAHRS